MYSFIVIQPIVVEIFYKVVDQDYHRHPAASMANNLPAKIFPPVIVFFRVELMSIVYVICIGFVYAQTV